MASHNLDILLKPRSVAIVGASDRTGTNGHAMMTMCAIDGFEGRVYPINPRLERLEGKTCFPNLVALPEVPEHVVIGVASRHVEDVLDQAIALGVRSATIFASCYLEGDGNPALPQRLRIKARAVDMLICGANCMGFYTPGTGLRVASMYSPQGIRRGGIAWIAQSGSAFGALAHNDRRLGFSLCISTGMEMVTTVADYMDWAVIQPETRVIGLFLETIRDPIAFVAALAAARAASIPVVAIKVGRTEKSAQMAVSHTGAIAGNDAVYEAVFRKYGVIRVADMDEMAATLALFDIPRKVAVGQLGTIHDSGGERELVVDIADSIGLGFAELEPTTCDTLQKHLEPGLHPENPLDVYCTNRNLMERNAAMIAALVNDPNVAMGFFMSNPRDDYGYADQYVESLVKASGMTDKPLALVTNYSMTDERELSQQLLRHGIPLIRGTRNALLAARRVLNWRDRLIHPRPSAPSLPNMQEWRDRLAAGTTLSEYEGLKMLSGLGVDSPHMVCISGLGDLPGATVSLRFPVVLKTAEDYPHKSEVGGVILNLPDAESVKIAYEEMATRLGPKALVAEMVPKGIELALGSVWDDGFGPVTLISAGGVLMEFLDDSVAALAPFDETEALRLLRTLRVFRLLQGVRGQPPIDLDALAKFIAAFSRTVASLGKTCGEIDINPLVCTEDGPLALDCLVVPRESP